MVFARVISNFFVVTAALAVIVFFVACQPQQKVHLEPVQTPPPRALVTPAPFAKRTPLPVSATPIVFSTPKDFSKINGPAGVSDPTIGQPPYAKDSPEMKEKFESQKAEPEKKSVDDPAFLAKPEGHIFETPTKTP